MDTTMERELTAYLNRKIEMVETYLEAEQGCIDKMEDLYGERVNTVASMILKDWLDQLHYIKSRISRE